MDLSTFAGIIGIMDLLFGIPALLSPKKTLEWMRTALQEDIWMRTIGALLLILSFLLLRQDASVTLDVSGFIRLMAWGSALKGLALCWRPTWHRKWQKYFLSSTSFIPLWGGMATILGFLFLSWSISL